MYQIYQIRPIENFKLILEYTDRVTVIVDFLPIIQQGNIFSPLQDPDFFSQVSLDLKGRYIYWEDEIEFCADSLRMKGIEIKSSITNYMNKELMQK
jgi:hypothetical protein